MKSRASILCSAVVCGVFTLLWIIVNDIDVSPWNEAKDGDQRHLKLAKSQERGKGIDRLHKIDRKIEAIPSIDRNIQILDGYGITAQGKDILGLNDDEVIAVKNSLHRVRMNLLDEIGSRLREVDDGDGSVIEYEVAAFPEVANELQSNLRSEVENIVGKKLADLVIQALEVDPRFLGFGKYDLYFRLEYDLEESNPSHSEDGRWKIYHEERLMGSNRVASKNMWNGSDFIDIFGFFQIE